MNGLQDSIRILQQSGNPEELAKAAESLAASSNENDLMSMERFFRDGNFLRRLDPPAGHGIEVDRFRQVLLVLGRNPHPYATRVLQIIGGDSHINSETDRVDVLLEAAAALRPLPPERAPLFRSFGRKYFLLNMKLLVDNGSSTAVEEMEQELLGKPADVEDESVVNVMHRAFVPHRTDEPLIRVSQDLVARDISSTIRTGLFESFFDYEPRHWYGPVRVPPEPAKFDTASTAALQELLKLAGTAEHAAIRAELKEKVNDEVTNIHAALVQRGIRPRA
jgi:hypothetical protein